jgi:DNA-binding MarR family transcriptional regulator
MKSGLQPIDSGMRAANLPCTCASLRRAARAVTRLYDHELRASGLKATQFTLLMALHTVGNTTQRELGEMLALDSTTLTRTLGILVKEGVIRAVRGRDRRERHLSLTREGQQRFRRARPDWERAQRRLKHSLGEPGWQQLRKIAAQVTQAAS